MEALYYLLLIKRVLFADSFYRRNERKEKKIGRTTKSETRSERTEKSLLVLPKKKTKIRRNKRKLQNQRRRVGSLRQLGLLESK